MQTKLKITSLVAVSFLSLFQFAYSQTITFSSTNPTVVAANLPQGYTKQPIYKASFVLSGGWGANLSQFSFIANGTFSPSDINYAPGASGYTLWINTTDDLSSAQLLSNQYPASSPGSTVTITTRNPWLNPGRTYYMWLTADVSPTASTGHTLTVAALSGNNFTFSQSPTNYSMTGNLYAGGTQTISFPKQFRSVASGDWSTLSTWQESGDKGATWVAATTTPSSSDDAITIQNGNTVTVSNNLTIDQTTINSGGQITVSSGASLTVADGAGTDLTVNGYLLNQGSVSQSGSITFNSGSTYQHDIDGGLIPSATWDTSSSCNVTGMINNKPTGLNQTFGNFTWNCSNQTGASSVSGNMTVNGNFNLISGRFTLNNVTYSSSPNYSLYIGGNYTQTGGVFDFNRGNYGTSSVYLTGNMSNTAGSGSITTSGYTNNGQFIFRGNSQSLNIPNSGAAIWIDYIINNNSTVQLLSNLTLEGSTTRINGTIDVGNYTITDINNNYPSSFTLNSGATIITANSNGLTSSGLSGSIQVGGTRTYSSNANYIYNSSTAQATGNGLTQANNLTIIGGSIKTLSSTTTINSTGILTIDAGNTLAGSMALMLNGNVIITATNNNSNGATISTPITLGGSTPIFNVADGSAATDLTVSGIITGSGGITKAGNGIMVLAAGNTYTGNTSITAGILSISNTNTISNTSPLILTGGTFSTGLTTGYTEQVSTLTLNDNSTIALGTGSHNLKFDSSAGMTWTTGKILTITGWEGNWNGSAGTIERIYVGDKTSGLTSSQLNQITFFNSTNNTYYGASIISKGEIVPNNSIKAPSITVSPSSVTYVGVVGSNSTSQPITITGKYLPYPISVTAPAAYQLSTDNSTWSSSGGTATLGKNGGILYIRYTPATTESSTNATFNIASGSTTQTFTATGTAYQNAIYVRQNGRGNKDGTSWTNAMATVQNATETSLTLLTQLPVYVAAGSYTNDPNYTLGDYATYSSGSWQGWTNNFVIRSGVNVYGSFPEYGTSNNNNADMTSRVVLNKATQYATTLNGGNDIRVLGPPYTSTPLGGGTGLSTSTIWDGFILTGANMQTCSSGKDDACGAGAYILPNFTLSNCIIESNSTSNNTTNDGAGAEMDGGTLYNCIIRNNTTGSGSGGNSNAGTINIRSGGSNVINCLIYGNYAYYAGGGMSMNLSSNSSIPCYIINNTIAYNTAPNRSSGIHIFGSNEMFYFYNNAVWNNSVSGVIADNEKNNAWPSGYGSTLGSGSVVLDASNVAPATSGSSYFPKFANPTTDNTADYRLQTSSSLINAGITSASGAPAFPGTDIRGLSRDSRYDIGCYEKTTMYYYVNNASANNTPNGLNWTTPYKTIQDALDMYNANDSTQIWVAAGTGSYLPSKNSSGTSSTGNDATFVLKPNLGLYGGFAGTPGTEPTNDADAITKINARLLKQYSTTIASNTTASTNLIKYSSTLGSKGAIVDGFTITGAGSGDYAVTIDNAKIQNCKIISNAGGGLSLNNGSNAFNILVANNGANGVFFAGTPNNASVINATIVNNTGAALSSSSTSPTVKNTIIWNNTGGNISGSTPAISNSAGTSSYGTVTWPSGASNIDLAERTPNFKNPSAKNYELLLISPCLDSGDATANSLPKDLNGNPRKYSSKVDMGAFQKWDGITIDGSYASYSIKNIRKGYVVPISKLTASNDTTEVLITKGTKFDMGGSSNLRVKWLEIKDSTDVNSSLNPPMVANGSITADSVLYVRTFPLYVTGSTTVHAWNFFGVPYPVSVGKLDGATPETSVRIQQYSESTRATNGANKSAWNNLSTASLLNVGTGYSLNLNSTKRPFRQTIIFPSNGGAVTLSSTGSGNVSGLSYTTTGSQSWTERGWNFISNPYPQSAYIKYQSPSSGYWPGAMTSGNIAGGYAGGVFIYNANIDYYDIWTLSDFQSVGLSPFGACFIKNGNVSPSLTKVQFIPEPTTNLSSTPLRTRSLTEATPSDSPVQFRLDINGNNASSRTYVLFHPNASPDATELEDIPNMSATSNGKNIAMNTFSSNSNIGLGINILPFKGMVMTVPLQVSVPTAGNYTITLPQKNDTVEVYIKDNSGTVTNLNSSSYMFSTTNASTSTSNFTLLFKKSNVTPEENSSGITLIQNRTNVSIFNPDVINRIFVYTPAGQLYKQRDVNSNQISFDLPSISGVYLVKIITDKGTFTKKVVNP